MAAHPARDQLVSGRYQWREELGRGGFGVVWRAHDTLLQRDVAVKVIEFPPILADSEKAAIRKRVLREARAAARLNHPGLVTVFDVVEEDGRPLIVMELVKAPTLAALVASRGPLTDERVAAIGLKVLDALEVAHGQGIIHRDVKPANVMVGDSGHVQLGDFGIAAVLDDPRVTTSGALAGSPSYMSPEQARNQTPSAATDLWGLGTTMYFALDGEPPFRKPGAIATLAAVVQEPHRPLQRRGEMARLVDDLLSKEPQDRPSSAEVRRRLETIVAGGSADAAVDGSATVELDPGADWADVPVAEASPVPTPAPNAVPAPAAVEDEADAEQLPASPSPGPPAPAVVSQPASPSSDLGPARPLLAPLMAVVGAVALVVVAVALVTNRGSSRSPSPAPAPPATSTASQATPRTTSHGPTTVQVPPVPKGWTPYTDPSTGFSIAYPPGWTVSTNGTLTDFRDPSSRAYLRVDHREPPGPSPEGAWYELEPSFASSNANYRRIQITPTTYEGYRAAIWEYTYSGGGADLHAADLGFVTLGHGFALNFQTAAPDWDRLQPVFEGFKAAFKAPAA
ncbi:MAG: serine/threonine-protein kinase [Acidimicrobiales bacterium]